MIWEIVRSHSPNKVLWAIPPPVDTAEQLLPWSTTTLSWLRSGYCLRAPTTISPTQFSHIFDFFVFMHNMKQYVCRNLCENFRQIGKKMKLGIAFTR